MTAEIGQFALILALTIAAAQSVVPQIGAWRRDPNLMAFASWAALAQFAFLALAFAMLARAFVVSDFSLLVVASNSNTAMPPWFRFSASWGNHEGSLLLWVLILAAFGAGVAALGRGMPEGLKARVLAVQGLIAFGFLALTLFTSNPFERLHPAPHNGMELNPLLQDIGLVIHPPFLYLGYVGFSMAFSFAAAALLEGKVDAAWARMVRPWILIAWICLTIGITLGSYWAYYELGWGGWWFWDPVENASFMPWLVGTALLHSAIVVERRQSLIVWTLLLSILTFSLSLVGTFLVRSGILTSVHAFVTDPARGMAVLLLLVLFTGGALTLFAFRAGSFDEPVSFRPVSREGGLILNNILLIVAAGIVFLGTFYPLVIDLVGKDKISVGPPYYNRSFVPLVLFLMLVVTVGPYLRWKRDKLGEALGRLRRVALVSVAVTVALIAFFGLDSVGPALGLGLAFWLVGGAMAFWLNRIQLFRAPAGRSWELARNTPRSVLGMVMGHAGLGLMLAGIVCVTQWEQESIVALPPGGSTEAGGYVFTLRDVTLGVRDNFEHETGTVDVTRNGRLIEVLHAERRFFPVAGNVTTEAAISAHGLTNLYVSMGGPAGPDAWVVRVYYHPMVLLIWFGPALMAFGGLLSLTDRRLRIGLLGSRTPPVAVPA